jgi:predicted SAM-dependent methyltransferase
MSPSLGVGVANMPRVSLKSTVAPAVRPVLETTTRPLGRRRFARAVVSAPKPLTIHIGSGNRRLPGWVNTDVTWNAQAYLDATQPWPVPPGSVSLVFADNMIEHISLALGREFLGHAYEALAPGGLLRVATPDVERVARQYLENGELARAGLERHRERGRDLNYPVELLFQVFTQHGHHKGFLYDFASLGAEMRAVGFEVTRREAGDSSDPDLGGLEARLHPAEVATTLIVEGRKPTA